MAEVAGIAGEQLRQFIERIERLEEEKKAISENIAEVFTQAKSTGFDIKIMRQVIKLRKMDNQTLQEQEYMIDLYRKAIGMND